MEMFMPFLSCHIETIQQGRRSIYTTDKKIKYLYEKVFLEVNYNPNDTLVDKYEENDPDMNLIDLFKNSMYI